MSRPRLATFVAIRNWIFPARKAASVRSRSRCDRPPWSAATFLPRRFSVVGQSVHADLRVAEDEEPIESVALVELDERRDLVLLGDEVDELADGLDGPEVRPHGDVRRVRLHEAVADAEDRVRHRRAEERRLAGPWRAAEDRLDVDDEAHVEHPVGLVEDDGVDAVEEQLAASDEVEHAARRADHDLRAALEGVDLAVHARAAVDGDGAHATEAADPRDLVLHLDAELAGRGQDQRLDVGARRLDLLDDRDAEGGGLAGPGLRLADEVLATPQRRDGAILDLGGRHEAHRLDGAGDRGRDLDLAEAVAARGGEDGGLELGRLLCRGCGDLDGDALAGSGRAASARAGALGMGVGQTELLGRRRRSGSGPVAARGWASKCYHASSADP